MEVKIYALIDPITLKVRYIGRTRCTLQKRLAEHVSKSKGISTHKANWIKSLLRINSKPYIRLLAVVNGWKESHDFERSLINKYADRLLNHEDRGEGGVNHITTEVTKTKISTTLKERYITGDIINPAWKTVYVYNLNGEYLDSFPSGKQAADALGMRRTDIAKCTTGIIKQFYGYQFSHTRVETMPIITRKPKINKYMLNEKYKYNG